MYELIKLAHLAAAIIWMGGMTMMIFALRPAAMAVLDSPMRASLMQAVWHRSFVLIIASIVVLFTTGTNLYTTTFRAVKAATGVGAVPLGWNLMLVLGLAMMLIFGHIFFAGFRRFKQAAAMADWAVAAKAAAQIHALMVTNFILGWLAIAAMRLVA
jgi:uncharacterized membrane protein